MTRPPAHVEGDFGQSADDSRVASDDAQANPDCAGFRKVYDWVEKDDGRTVLMSAIQTVGAKSWEWVNLSCLQCIRCDGGGA